MVKIESASIEQIQQLVEIDKLVHEPSRLMILLFLESLEEIDFLFLLRQTQLTQGNLSSHLAKLELAGYVTVKKEFIGKRPHTIASLSVKGAEALERYRDKIVRVLSTA